MCFPWLLPATEKDPLIMFETVSLDSRLLQDMSCCQNGSRRWAHMGTPKTLHTAFTVSLCPKNEDSHGHGVRGIPGRSMIWSASKGNHLHQCEITEAVTEAIKLAAISHFQTHPPWYIRVLLAFYVPNIFKYHILSSPVWNPNFGDLLPLFHDSKPPFLTTTPGVKLHWRSQRPWSPVQMEPMPMEIRPGSAVWPGRFWTSPVENWAVCWGGFRWFYCCFLGF